MKNNTKIIVGLVVVLVLVLGIWFVVGRPPAEEPVAEEPAVEEPAVEEPAVEEPAAEEPVAEEPGEIYPLDTDVVITYWLGLPAPHVSANFTNYAETPFYKWVMEETGVQIEFLHPPEGQAVEQFNLMIASGDLPDVMEWNWLDFPGGPQKALDDEIIIPLNDLIESYAPNFRALLDEVPSWDRAAKTDLGIYYTFPFIRDTRGDDFRLLVHVGPMVRRDWLDDLGLSVPETIADWEAMLTAFRDEKGAVAPLTYERWALDATSTFLSAFDARMTFFHVDGEVKWGPIEPGFRDFLELFSRWYAEGLIDQEIGVVDRLGVEAKIITGQAGAAIGTKVGRLGYWLELMRDDPNFDLVGTTKPVVTLGDRPMFGHRARDIHAGAGIGITTRAEEHELEIITRFADFAYGEQGHILFNFGRENESFTWVDGKPTYMDHIYNHPEGWPIVESLSQYVRSTTHGPFVQDQRYIWQYAFHPQQEEAYLRWRETDERLHMLPPGFTPSPEEASELASIMADANTKRDEVFLRILVGEAGLEEWDTFVADVSDDIARAIEIHEAAIQRFNAR